MDMQTLAEKMSAGVFNDILNRDFSRDMISELAQMNAVQLENKLKDILAVPIGISKQGVFACDCQSQQGADTKFSGENERNGHKHTGC